MRLDHPLALGLLGGSGHSLAQENVGAYPASALAAAAACIILAKEAL